MGRPEPPAAGIVNKRWLWWALPSLLLAILAVLIRLGGTSAWDLGDGALHYLQARWAPWHAHLFFDRWAKPVYVVLGTAFAQWGPTGMVVFDALLAAATAITILTLIGPDRKRVAWLVPIMLFGSIQYFKVVVSGLTEPLFGLVSVLVVLLLFHRRYTAAMALLSFTPFIRPEYVVLAPMLVLWTAYKRQWKALPWLALGPVLYMLAGRILLGERFLNFARDPYEDNTLYPPGGWDNFLVQAADILGEPLLILFLLCLPVMALLWSKDKTRRPAYQAIMVLVLAPVVGIWAIHSYAYWAGGHGSAGLLRVLATATPLTVLFVAYTLFQAARRWEIKRSALLFGLFTLGYFAWAQDDLRYRLPLPARPTTEQLMVEAAMKDAMAQIGPGGRIATGHPYSAVLVGQDPWAPDHAGSDYVDLATLELGDILEWNSEYATQRPDLAGSLLQDDRFSVLALHGEGFGWGYAPKAIWLFQRTANKQVLVTDTLLDLGLRPDTIQSLWKDPYPCRLPAGNALCGSDIEFPLTIANLQPSNVKDPVLTEWRLELELDMQADGQGELIALCSIDNAAGDQSAFYQEEGLRHGTNLIKFRIGGALLDRPAKLMLWNRGHRPYQITDLRLVRSSRSHPR